MPVQYVSFDVTVTCRVDCEMERNDYGVRGSPVWYEPDLNTIEVSAIAFDEVNISSSAIPKDLLEHIEEIAAEKAMDNGEWE